MPARFGLAAMGSKSATTFLVNENCEGTGTPAGWTNSDGTPNWDYSAAPLADSQSLYLSTAAAAHRAFINFGAQNEVWGYFRLKLTNGSAPAGDRNVMMFTSSGLTTPVVSFVIPSTLRPKWGTTNTAQTTDALVIGTDYHVWVHYKVGTGADAIYEVGFSTTGTRPTSGNSYAIVTTGIQTTIAGRIYVGANITTVNTDLIFDNIRVAATQIGDSGT